MNGIDWLQQAADFGGLESKPCRAIHNRNTKSMTDLIYIAVIALFFVAGQFYAHWCEKL
jgi:hypothetical protein